MSPPDSEAMAKLWLQYTHLEKLYGYLPGMAETQPAIFGLPLGPDQSVLAVGDSATDDLQSWAEILRHLLDLRRPGDRVRVVNGGLSAHTTAMVLRRWPAALAQRPDWVVCLPGGNDVTRVGPAPAKPQLGLAESIANLVELRRIATQLTSARWVWMTPTPVREDRVAEFPAFRHGQSTWRNADLLALAEAVGRFGEPVVDLVAAFGTPPDSDLLGPDGVHPTLAGQAAIVTALVEHLTTSSPTTGDGP